MWTYKTMFQTRYRKWIKITSSKCYAIVRRAKKFDYLVNFVAWEIFRTLIDVGSLKYFKARVLLRAPELLVIEGNICKQINALRISVVTWRVTDWPWYNHNLYKTPASAEAPMEPGELDAGKKSPCHLGEWERQHGLRHSGKTALAHVPRDQVSFLFPALVIADVLQPPRVQPHQ